MPRIRQNAEKYADSDFLREIRVRMAYLNIPYAQDLADMAGIPNSTLAGKLREPGKFTVAQLRKIIKTVNPDPDVLLRFLGCEKTNK